MSYEDSLARGNALHLSIWRQLRWGGPVWSWPADGPDNARRLQVLGLAALRRHEELRAAPPRRRGREYEGR